MLGFLIPFLQCLSALLATEIVRPAVRAIDVPDLLLR